MSFKVLHVIPCAVTVNPGSFIWVNHIDGEGVQYRLEARIYSAVDIIAVYIYEHDGQYGIDYTVARFNGVRQ